jgi:hypothetical protein
MTPASDFKPDEIELIPEAWERFERAVDTVSKSAPIHRVAQRGTASLNRIKALVDFIWTTAPYRRSLPEPLLQRARELAEFPDRWVAGSFRDL